MEPAALLRGWPGALSCVRAGVACEETLLSVHRGDKTPQPDEAWQPSDYMWDPVAMARSPRARSAPHAASDALRLCSWAPAVPPTPLRR